MKEPIVIAESVEPIQMTCPGCDRTGPTEWTEYRYDDDAGDEVIYTGDCDHCWTLKDGIV